MSYPQVGIGILNWNGKKYLEEFLPFFSKVTYPAFTIYVIDNNSSDDSIAFLQEHYPQVKIIQTYGNFGVAGGYNIGFDQMPEPYVMMLNSDVEITPGFIEPLVEILEKDATVAACQSKMLSFQHRDEFEYGGGAGGEIDILGYSFCRGRIFDTVEKDHAQYTTAPVFWGGGAALLIRRTAYKEVGGMYAYYFMHFEEVDLCWKFHSYGYSVVCCNESIVYHVGGGSLSYQSPRKTYYNFRNNLIMCYRNSTPLYRIWWLPVRFMTDVVASLSYALKKDGKNAAAVFKGYKGFFKWLFKEPNKYPGKRSSLLDIKTTFKGSVVFRYFISGKKTYAALKK